MLISTLVLIWSSKCYLAAFTLRIVLVTTTTSHRLHGSLTNEKTLQCSNWNVQEQVSWGERFEKGQNILEESGKICRRKVGKHPVEKRGVWDVSWEDAHCALEEQLCPVTNGASLPKGISHEWEFLVTPVGDSVTERVLCGEGSSLPRGFIFATLQRVTSIVVLSLNERIAISENSGDLSGNDKTTVQQQVLEEYPGFHEVQSQQTLCCSSSQWGVFW